MRPHALWLLLLAACQSTDAPPEVDLAAQLHARGLAFGQAMEHRDFGAAIELAAPSAKGFFRAEKEFDDLLWEHEQREPKAVAVEEVERRGDDRGLVTIVTGAGDEERRIVLHLQLTDGEWGVLGFARDAESPPMMFADREAGTRERLARAREEMEPHPQLGPMVEAYMKAAMAKDVDGMTAHMTSECAAKERKSKRSFTRGFADGEFTIQKWRFTGHDVEDNEATQRVRTILVMADGETDGEPIRFEFDRSPGGWLIRAVN